MTERQKCNNSKTTGYPLHWVGQVLTNQTIMDSQTKWQNLPDSLFQGIYLLVYRYCFNPLKWTSRQVFSPQYLPYSIWSLCALTLKRLFPHSPIQSLQNTCRWVASCLHSTAARSCSRTWVSELSRVGWKSYKSGGKVSTWLNYCVLEG